ncbi:tetratricopeptide repeat protein [Plebeiibacterium marinum]|uniref:Tetratricopeptide repeat protein n=1 Tax=Plebeiibacterium marinum TaxID=2992111 RepID=A0AAE3MCG9_9BACT|nr:tetratricopeptide repeat protein [Plebeiobacterium marinum]MCW3805228.1 tetratricopeptide repeat protein [Plebeiobacterium marinum]
MHRISFSLLVIFIVSTFCVQAQSNSEDHIKEGNELCDEGKYAEAIETYRLVHENDSNYSMVLAEIAMAYLGMEKYDSALVAIDQGLALNGSSRCHLLRTKGVVYKYMGQPEKSIETYRDAIKEYPFEYLLHYSLGASYVDTKDFREAQKCFQEALRCNPFHASSHMYLGNLAARQKQYTRAMLSLETFLALEPASSRSNRVLVFIENLSNNYMDTTQGCFIDPIDDNSVFKEIDHYFRARIVLTDRYALPIEFNASLVKQSKMIMETLPYDRANDEKCDDFWAQMYFPFFYAIYHGGHISPFLYTLLRSTGQDDVIKYNEKNEKELDALYGLGGYLSIIQKHRRTNIIGEEKLYDFAYYDNGKVYSIGNKNSSGNKDGEWRYYHNNGEISAEGYYNDGKKSGEWRYFLNDGSIKSQGEN